MILSDGRNDPEISHGAETMRGGRIEDARADCNFLKLRTLRYVPAVYLDFLIMSLESSSHIGEMLNDTDQDPA